MSDDSTGWRRLSWPRPLRIPREVAQDADRRAGEQLAGLLDERDRADVEHLLAAGKPIPAVRRVRELTGLRLIDAKRLVESLQDQARLRSVRLDP
jgi:ribosomal protein L7/L12